MKAFTLMKKGDFLMMSVIETEDRTEEIFAEMRAPVTPMNKTRLWRPGVWVVTPDQRIGLVAASKRSGRRWRTRVQLGSGGPFRWYNAGRLRRATQEEIDEVNGASRKSISKAEKK